MADNAFTISVKAGSKELTDYEIDYDWMRRNDFLTIPIYISNIETTLSWSESRMPIGGLPEKKFMDRTMAYKSAPHLPVR